MTKGGWRLSDGCRRIYILGVTGVSGRLSHVSTGGCRKRLCRTAVAEHALGVAGHASIVRRRMCGQGCVRPIVASIRAAVVRSMAVYRLAVSVGRCRRTLLGVAGIVCSMVCRTKGCNAGEAAVGLKGGNASVGGCRRVGCPTSGRSALDSTSGISYVDSVSGLTGQAETDCGGISGDTQQL